VDYVSLVGLNLYTLIAVSFRTSSRYRLSGISRVRSRLNPFSQPQEQKFQFSEVIINFTTNGLVDL